MNVHCFEFGVARRRSFVFLCIVSLGLLFALPIQAQDAEVPVDGATVDALMQPSATTPASETATAPSGIDLLSLIKSGGAFMFPIGLMSLLVVTLACERFLALRRKRIMPKPLVQELRRMCETIERFNPGVALGVCRDYPSPAARAVEAMLMRTGQPLAEIEQAAADAIQREADEYASPIRWLTLAAAATPLMGLLGTVWGMIIAFHQSATLAAERSRSEQLSEGIYIALVTTLAGLIVAIPAAISAQFLENRLAKLFHRVERFTFDLAPALGRFVGRMRLDPDGSIRSMHPAPPANSSSAPSTPPTAPPVGTATKKRVV